MNTLELNTIGLDEMATGEMQQTEGGFLPLAVMYGCWGIMIGCSLVATGMKQALKDYQSK